MYGHKVEGINEETYARTLKQFPDRGLLLAFRAYHGACGDGCTTALWKWKGDAKGEL